MLRSQHLLRSFVKLVLWDVYCVNGCGFFRLGYVGVGFGGNCDCRYGILYAYKIPYLQYGDDTPQNYVFGCTRLLI